MLVSTSRLRVLEDRGAQRRRLNRAMVWGGTRDPDTGEPFSDVTTCAPAAQRARARAVQAEAAATARSWLVLEPLPPDLPPLPELPAVPKGRVRAEPVLGSTAARALDLLVHGARPRQVQGILSISRNHFDYIVREACKGLAAAHRAEALSAWRARAHTDGRQPDQGDLAALAALRSQ